MLPKDYVVYKLTGNIYTEPSDASGTILYNIKSEEWSEELLNTLRINPNICPKVIGSHEKVVY